MKKVKVGVAGYGIIGQRLADGVARQGDMELVGIADIAPTISIRALRERGMDYNLYLVPGADKAKFDELKIPVSGTFEELVEKVDIMLDAAPGGLGEKNKELYVAKGKKAIFQGGEKDSIADAFFHGYANYEQGLNKNYLKLTSCNTTGLLRTVDCLDRAYGLTRVAITIVRRCADPGDYHRGLTNACLVDRAPTHQAIDLMKFFPHISSTGLLIHTPNTHGHLISVMATGKKKITKEMAYEAFKTQDRVRLIRIDDGFLGNASLFRYARDLGNPRSDMYEVGLWEDSILESCDDLMYIINIPQEAVTIPETIDGVRAAMGMQTERLAGVAETNKYLGIGKWKY